MHAHFLLTKKPYARGNISNQKVVEQIKLDKNADRRQEYTTMHQRAHSSTGTSHNNKKNIPAQSQLNRENNKESASSQLVVDDEQCNGNLGTASDGRQSLIMIPTMTNRHENEK